MLLFPLSLNDGRLRVSGIALVGHVVHGTARGGRVSGRFGLPGDEGVILVVQILVYGNDGLFLVAGASEERGPCLRVERGARNRRHVLR